MKDCPACLGKGKIKDIYGNIKKCQLCNGTGKSNAVNIFDL